MFNLWKKKKDDSIKKESKITSSEKNNTPLKENIKPLEEKGSSLLEKENSLLKEDKSSLLINNEGVYWDEKKEDKKEDKDKEKPKERKKIAIKKENLTNIKKKKEIVLNNITSYSEAIKAIKFFEATEEWEKAYIAIDEVKEKEKEAFDNIVSELEWSENIDTSEWMKQTKIFENKINWLNKTKEKIKKDEAEFRRKEEIKRFKVSFKQIKEKIKLLIKTKNNSDAMNLLTSFLEENKEKTLVIEFYNKQRKIILKNVEKERKVEEKKMSKNAKLEAFNLIWDKLKDIKKESTEKKVKRWFFWNIKEKLNFYTKVKENLAKKRLLDEVTLLIDEDDKIKKALAKEKLQNMHKWLIKEISNDDLEWYDLYWKILWADKISWDTFWFNESKEKYTFFIWDATWHGIRAWFIVTLLSKTFEQFVNKVSLKRLTFEINNNLKQNLQNKNFITWIIFQADRRNLNEITIAGMWHETLIIYRNKTKSIERFIPWGLAAWIRLMKDDKSIKEKIIKLDDGDMIFTYSDWITESKNEKWKMYTLESLEIVIHKIASIQDDPKVIYTQIIEDLKIFQWWTHFSDDASIIIFRRNKEKDKIKKNDEYLKELSKEQNLNKKDLKNLEWKNRTEIQLELDKIKKEKDLNNIVKSLDNLFVTWEILKLKQECIRFIKKWYIDKRINDYLKKAINNETKYKIDLKNQRVQNKYTVLTQLLKKWDYDTVIRESSDVISKQWVL